MAATSASNFARTTNHTLNGLIVACNDEARAQGAAARAVGGERRHRLEDAVGRRTTFVNELSQLIRDFGGHPSAGGSLVEGAALLFADMRSLVIGNHAGDRYATCARVEGKGLALYERALEGQLADSVRAVLERQALQVASDHEEWRLRRLM